MYVESTVTDLKPDICVLNKTTLLLNIIKLALTFEYIKKKVAAQRLKDTDPTFLCVAHLPPLGKIPEQNERLIAHTHVVAEY